MHAMHEMNSGPNRTMIRSPEEDAGDPSWKKELRMVSRDCLRVGPCLAERQSMVLHVSSWHNCASEVETKWRDLLGGSQQGKSEGTDNGEAPRSDGSLVCDDRPCDWGR